MKVMVVRMTDEQHTRLKDCSFRTAEAMASIVRRATETYLDLINRPLTPRTKDPGEPCTVPKPCCSFRSVQYTIVEARKLCLCLCHSC